MQEEKNTSVSGPSLTLHINVSKMHEKNWESAIYLASMLHLSLIVRTDLLMYEGVYSDSALFIKTDTNYNHINRQVFEAQISVLQKSQ